MSRYFEYKHAKRVLEAISKNPEKYILIHYSTSSFKKEEFPKTSSISLMRFENKERIQFSISKYLEGDMEVEEAELMLLEKFFEFIENNKNMIYIHWNMNSEMFGFEAIENRYRKLTGNLKNTLTFLKKEDLDDLLGMLYSEKYVGDSKMYNLYDLNKLSINGFTNGGDEVKLYEKGQWFEISRASTAKVDFIYEVIKLVDHGKLKVKNKFINRNTVAEDAIRYFFNEKILGRFLFWLGVTFIGAIIGAWVSELLFK
ncbi:hypothetical protein IGK06_002470 [Enterococcus sp. AZ142]|uniref:hypothetical protein n=1 Tax=Enterococcus sp. AZ142 TaxID=2774798 RepID=UPI003D26996A